MRRLSAVVATLIIAAVSVASAQQWPPSRAPVIPEADGFVVIPKAAMTPEKNRIYKAIVDATRTAKTPSDLAPALNEVGALLNAFESSKVPLKNVKLAVIFHGAAVDGILNDAQYLTKTGKRNPNIRVIQDLKKRGIELYVCGQHLARERIDPRSLLPEIQVASDASIVLIAYANAGYAVIPN